MLSLLRQFTPITPTLASVYSLGSPTLRLFHPYYSGVTALNPQTLSPEPFRPSFLATDACPKLTITCMRIKRFTTSFLHQFDPKKLPSNLMFILRVIFGCEFKNNPSLPITALA